MEPNVGAGLLHLGSPICLTKQFVPGDKDSGLPSSFVTSPKKIPWGSTLNSYFWDEWDLGLYWTVEMDLALVLVLMLVLMLVLVSVWVLK